jgi:hypothetical protein
MNISQTIKNEIRTLTLAAAEYRPVKTPGRYFLLVSNSLTTAVEVAIGNDSYQTWPVLFSCRTRRDDEFFDKVRFHNPAATAMTIEYIISTEDVDNRSTEVVGMVSVKDVSNTVLMHSNLVALPNNFLIDAAAAVNKGGGLVGIPVTSQPFNTGENVTIYGTVNYNGAYAVNAASSVNEVVIAATYVAETFDGVNDRIRLTTARSQAVDSARKELIVYNSHATQPVFWGDSTIITSAGSGIPIPPLTAFIITSTSAIYFRTDSGAGKSGCVLFLNSLRSL